ncbi:MAG: RNA polymerase sigma factor [Candidatus Omnitrophota bacterium]
MPVTPVNEEVLIQQAREGDPRSFSALVELYQERAVHVAYSFLGNYEDARDIAQEAFVKAYEKLGHFQGTSRFYTWFYRILANHCKDFLRKKKVRQWISLGLFKGEAEESDPIADVPATTRGADEALLDAELGSKISHALEKLPFQQKSAFILRYLEGLSLEEVAQSMDLSVGAVKAHLWHAAGKMRKSLGEYLSLEEA